jgi:hypothetical protein
VREDVYLARWHRTETESVKPRFCRIPSIAVYIYYISNPGPCLSIFLCASRAYGLAHKAQQAPWNKTQRRWLTNPPAVHENSPRLSAQRTVTHVSIMVISCPQRQISILVKRRTVAQTLQREHGPASWGVYQDQNIAWSPSQRTAFFVYNECIQSNGRGRRWLADPKSGGFNLDIIVPQARPAAPAVQQRTHKARRPCAKVYTLPACTKSGKRTWAAIPAISWWCYDIYTSHQNSPYSFNAADTEHPAVPIL